MLDAFEDYEQDAKTSQFNAIRTTFNLKDQNLTPEISRKIFAVLRGLENDIIVKIEDLPLGERQKQLRKACANRDRLIPADLARRDTVWFLERSARMAPTAAARPAGTSRANGGAKADAPSAALDNIG